MKKKYLSRRAVGFLAVVFLLLIAAVSLLWAYSIAERARYAAPAVATLALVGLGFWGYYWVLKPYRDTERVLMLFARGYTLEGIRDMRCQISPASDAAMERVRELLKTNQLITESKRQAQYLALQNQINPHFLYNTLEGIRSDAYAAGLNNVAKMTAALSTFFRYTISNLENLVTLDEELQNVDSYFIIQQYRFGERISLKVAFESDEDKKLLLKAKLPKLTLQPIVENAIIHGIEGKVGSGNITLSITGTGKRMIIAVGDDGLGMEQATLDRLAQKLNTTYYEYIRPDSEQAGGIALVNVNNRIRLLFGEGYGIAVYSTPGKGTDVEITLPYITGNAEREGV